MMHDGESADQRDRHGDQGNDRGSPGLEENDDHDDYQDDGFDQGVQHGLNRAAHEYRGIVGDVVVDALRKALLQLRHFGAHGVGDVDVIAAGPLEYRDGHRGP